MPHSRPSFLGIPLAAFVLLGCGRENVTHVQVPKTDPAPGPVSPMGSEGTLPPPPRPEPGKALRWTLPKGWTETRPGGMRVATLRPPVPNVEVSITVLPGPAGGELANVNRWRGQLGLPPVREADLVGLRTVVTSPAGTLALYDFTSEGSNASRMVVALFQAPDDSTWFLKMVGEAKAVDRVRPDFVNLLKGLNLG